MTDFDWVKARAACSLEAVFQLLGEVVDSDIKSANGLRRGRVEFSFHLEAARKIIAIRKRDMGGFSEIMSIVFELDLSTNDIGVNRRAANLDERLFRAKPSLSVDGECLLRVEGEAEPLKLWQVSRKALEDLFFGF